MGRDSHPGGQLSPAPSAAGVQAVSTGRTRPVPLTTAERWQPAWAEPPAAEASCSLSRWLMSIEPGPGAG